MVVQAKKRKTVIAYIGNFVEFFEFGLFSALLPFISNELFATLETTLKTKLSYFILYVGFIGRPIGGYFFGKIGDRFGLKLLFFVSVLGISVTSLMMGLLPQLTYTWIFLLMLRFIQGIFTGAEQASATVFVTRQKDKHSTFTQSALLISFGILGVTAAQCVAYGMSLLSADSFFNWRHAFLLVSVVSFCAFMIRFKYFEDDFDETIRERFTHAQTSLSTYKVEICIFIVLCSIFNSLFYLINAYIHNISMIVTTQIIPSKFLMNLIATFLFSFFIVAWGIFLDRKKIEIQKAFYFSLVGLVLLLKPLFYTFSAEAVLSSSLLIQGAAIFFCQLLAVVTLNCLPGLFPSNLRIQATGLSLSVGASLVGGGMPFFATLLTGQNSSWNSLLFIIFGLLFIGGLGVQFLYSKSRLITNDKKIPNIRY
jgi:MHS family proline/betaine transporter-like MFS transporter